MAVIGDCNTESIIHIVYEYITSLQYIADRAVSSVITRWLRYTSHWRL